MARVSSKGGKPASGVLLSSSVLGACILSLAASAQLSAQGCAESPSSVLVVNVKDKGAKGDGRTNDTVPIQAAIDAIAGTGGTVFVPNGTYMVDAVDHRLTLKSDMALKLSEGATLKAIPNNSKHYSVLFIADASNVTVVGGTLQGDRDEHKGKSGEWGMGIRIGHGAKHIIISGVTAREMWGDGFYVQGATDVRFCSVTADNNRRQGLSIIEADGLVVTNSVFKNTHGTRPSAGIDLEPNTPEQKITNVRIENSKFLHNAGGGIQIAGKKGRISNVAITSNVFRSGRPILVENAPAVLSSAICGNRHIAYQSEPSGGLNAFGKPVEVVALQRDCQEGRDPRFEVNRQKKRNRRK